MKQIYKQYLTIVVYYGTINNILPMKSLIKLVLQLYMYMIHSPTPTKERPLTNRHLLQTRAPPHKIMLDPSLNIAIQGTSLSSPHAGYK